MDYYEIPALLIDQELIQRGGVDGVASQYKENGFSSNFILN